MEDQPLTYRQEMQIIWALIHHHGWEFCPEHRELHNPLTGEYLIIPEDKVTTLLLITANFN